MWGEVRVGTRGVAAAQAACTGGARLKRCGGQGMRGAHGEHAAHVLDTGRVEAQRLVKHPRVLPRVERRAYGAGQGAGWGAGGPGAVRRRKRHAHGEGSTGRWVRARAERTLNMLSMVVTLEVSKFSGWLKALAFCRVEKEGMA